MSEAEDFLTFDELRTAQSKERNKDTLQELDEGFFERAKNYLDMKKKKGSYVENKEYRNAKHILEDIVDRRQKKIVKLAFLSVKSGVKVNNLLKREEDLFDEVKYYISEYRDELHEELFTEQTFTTKTAPETETITSDTEEDDADEANADDEDEEQEPTEDDAFDLDTDEADEQETAADDEEKTADDEEAADTAEPEDAEEPEENPAEEDGDDIITDNPKPNASDDVQDDPEDEATDDAKEHDDHEAEEESEKDKVVFGGNNEAESEDDNTASDSNEADDDEDQTAEGDPDVASESSEDILDESAATDEDGICIKITENVPEFMGVDLEAYGPFEEGDEVAVPETNADVLIDQGKAEKA